jgi:hypothetical protein
VWYITETSSLGIDYRVVVKSVKVVGNGCNDGNYRER